MISLLGLLVPAVPILACESTHLPTLRLISDQTLCRLNLETNAEEILGLGQVTRKVHSHLSQFNPSMATRLAAPYQ